MTKKEDGAHNFKRDGYKEFHFIYHTTFLPSCRRRRRWRWQK